MKRRLAKPKIVKDHVSFNLPPKNYKKTSYHSKFGSSKKFESAHQFMHEEAISTPEHKYFPLHSQSILSTTSTEYTEEYCSKLLECTEPMNLQEPSFRQDSYTHIEDSGEVYTLELTEETKEKDYLSSLHDDIISYMKIIEVKERPSHLYMKTQSEVNEKMRALLVDWIIEVTDKFGFGAETLFLTVNILDRFLSKTQVKIIELQLIGTASMVIAAKYYETFLPSLDSFVKVSDNSFNKIDITDTELKILQCLDYYLNTPSPFTFLGYYRSAIKEWTERLRSSINFLGKIVEGSGVTHLVVSLIQYFIHLQLLECRVLEFSPSALFSAALLLAVRQIGQNWSKELEDVTGYKEKELEKCVEWIKVLAYERLPLDTLHAAHKKFAKLVYMKVAEVSGCSCPQEVA